MTEAEWWSATDPCTLADWLFFDALATDRKLRLFSVACCQPIVSRLQQFAAPVAALLSLVEGFADGREPATVFDQPCEELCRLWREYDDEGCRRYRESMSEGVSAADTITDEEVSFWFVSQCGMRAASYGTFHAAERDRSDSHYRQRDFYHGRRDRRLFPRAAAAEAVQAVVDTTDRPEEEVRTEVNAYQVRLLHDIFGPLPFRDIAVQPSWLTSDVMLLARGIYDEKAFDRMPILADALQDAGCDNPDILNHCRARNWEHVRGCWVIDLLLGRPWREEVITPRG